MLEGIFSSEVYQVLEKSLNASSLQHKMISNNIANVNTPGFKRSEVVFQSKLSEILDKKDKEFLPLSVTNINHIPSGTDFTLAQLQPEVVTNSETSLRTDDNNVDIDYEMAKMAENTTNYSTLAQLMSLKISGLKTAITEGGR
ncbi:MAG TPA: flagellar basal body rod protein FlgB [Candidatus Goldiibacteriota bacterium]|nr:flagellar basal body rod protein FlgB [Candidatus Goldiibacteriota bacterium]HPI04059.1 flagellar basal body rod protein FlgB [Candidatus Goldiibacteriota bacterium]HPN64873.1 flagellar basal body rod protein FlgB [Candidatus Goldiibacteriota bacterium]HRQ43932.1 flagellar basal body rod protein FlgB [Candidatus Goldiibacteriota bacterium]